MTLYRRIPKNWLERIWFKFRPQVVEIVEAIRYEFYDGPDKLHIPRVSYLLWNRPDDYVVRFKNGAIYIYPPMMFEANYEPIAPIAPNKNQLHQAGNMVDHSVHNNEVIFRHKCTIACGAENLKKYNETKGDA